MKRRNDVAQCSVDGLSTVQMADLTELSIYNVSIFNIYCHGQYLLYLEQNTSLKIDDDPFTLYNKVPVRKLISCPTFN